MHLLLGITVHTLVCLDSLSLSWWYIISIAMVVLKMELLKPRLSYKCKFLGPTPYLLDQKLWVRVISSSRRFWNAFTLTTASIYYSTLFLQVSVDGLLGYFWVLMSWVQPLQIFSFSRTHVHDIFGVGLPALFMSNSFQKGLVVDWVQTENKGHTQSKETQKVTNRGNSQSHPAKRQCSPWN